MAFISQHRCLLSFFEKSASVCQHLVSHILLNAEILTPKNFSTWHYSIFFNATIINKRQEELLYCHPENQRGEKTKQNAWWNDERLLCGSRLSEMLLVNMAGVLFYSSISPPPPLTPTYKLAIVCSQSLCQKKRRTVNLPVNTSGTNVEHSVLSSHQRFISALPSCQLFPAIKNISVDTGP